MQIFSHRRSTADSCPQPGPQPPEGGRPAWASRSSDGGRSLVVVTPRGLGDAPAVIEAVRSNRVVVVNSAWLEDAPGQRLIDFICGGLAAIGGQVHRIAEEVFLFAPASTSVTAEAWQRSVGAEGAALDRAALRTAG
ncbi:MAG: cell division protein SepF [Cyanobium sp.]|nr:cell division protein SepF [Cyanobium sp.]